MGKNGDKIRAEKAKRNIAEYRPYLTKKQRRDREKFNDKISTALVNGIMCLEEGIITKEELVDALVSATKER